MPTLRSKRWLWMVLSLILTSVLTIPAAYWLIPHLFCRKMVSHLTHPTLSKRQFALNYVMARAAADPRLRRGAIAKLDVADQDNFLQIAHSLDQAQLWERTRIPDVHWLRWLSIIATSSEANSRSVAVNLVAELVDLADDPRLITLLDTLLEDQIGQVRQSALLVAAELSGAANERETYERLIRTATTDSDPQVARLAWLLVGLMKAAVDSMANWSDKPPEVAEAILWAALHRNPDYPEPAIKALTDPSVNLSVRVMAAYALGMSDTVAAQDALANLIPAQLHQVTTVNQRLIWRAILCLGNVESDARPASRSYAEKAIRTFIGTGQETEMVQNELLRPLLLAVTYHVPSRPNGDLRDLVAKPLLLLASLEGGHVGQMPATLTAQLPELLRVVATAVVNEPKLKDLRNLFDHPAETIRDLACVIAAQRFTNEQIEPLVATLLSDFNDDAKCSGAILAGLTGAQQQLLEKKLQAEDIWSVLKIMELARHMQDHRVPDEGSAAALLTRDDLPRTTILLALLHSGSPVALDTLLNPRGEPLLPLVELFDKARWWYVVRRYMARPPECPPAFWFWADPQLQRFQVELIRLWYLLHRHWTSP